jgi:hypothetical protein
LYHSQGRDSFANEIIFSGFWAMLFIVKNNTAKILIIKALILMIFVFKLIICDDYGTFTTNDTLNLGKRSDEFKKSQNI